MTIPINRQGGDVKFVNGEILPCTCWVHSTGC